MFSCNYLTSFSLSVLFSLSSIAIFLLRAIVSKLSVDPPKKLGYPTAPPTAPELPGKLAMLLLPPVADGKAAPAIDEDDPIPIPRPVEEDEDC